MSQRDGCHITQHAASFDWNTSISVWKRHGRAHLWLPRYTASVLVKPRPVRNSPPPRLSRKQVGCFYRRRARTRRGFCSYYVHDNVLGVWAWPLLPNGRQSVCIIAHVRAHEPQRKLPAMRSLAWQPKAFGPVTNHYEFTETLHNTTTFTTQQLHFEVNTPPDKRGVRKRPKCRMLRKIFPRDLTKSQHS